MYINYDNEDDDGVLEKEGDDLTLHRAAIQQYICVCIVCRRGRNYAKCEDLRWCLGGGDGGYVRVIKQALWTEFAAWLLFLSLSFVHI